jgi:mono/diheme cytochrome c family protein
MTRHALLSFVMVLTASAASAQPAASTPPAQRLDGKDLYKTYCASCHGTTGLGNGPVAEALKKPPANLTLFSLSNGGVFPAAKLRRIIDGREVIAHGTPDMPVWGAVFKVPGRGVTEADVRARIDAIVAYIESIQMRRGQ